LAEQLVAYGLGRSFGFTDEPLIAELLAKAASENMTFPALIHALTSSQAFLSK
jgi:hypothetical protein